jgi:hypothetical protein
MLSSRSCGSVDGVAGGGLNTSSMEMPRAEVMA